MADSASMCIMRAVSKRGSKDWSGGRRGHWARDSAPDACHLNLETSVKPFARLGPFTRRPVAKGTFLGEYVGVMSTSQCAWSWSAPV